MAHRLRRINGTTTATVNIIAQSSLPAGADIRGIDVSANGTIYVADFDNHVVYKIFESGRIEGVIIGDIGTSGSTLSDGITTTGLGARVNTPFGVCVDASDNIYLSDQTNRKVRRISPSGRMQTLAGDGTAGDVVHEDGTQARFSSTLGGICVDRAGIVYVADTGNHKIKKIEPNGRTTTLAGGPASAGASGFVNANGNTARFSSPTDVCVDRNGNVYVADTGNNRIRKITPMGDVTTLSGQTAPGITDGNGIDARFNGPLRVAMDPNSLFMYVQDGASNEAIRRVTMHGETRTFMPYKDVAGDIAVEPNGFLLLVENDT
jgi:streptogramin lyase